MSNPFTSLRSPFRCVSRVVLLLRHFIASFSLFPAALAIWAQSPSLRSHYSILCTPTHSYGKSANYLVFEPSLTWMVQFRWTCFILLGVIHARNVCWLREALPPSMSTSNTKLTQPSRGICGSTGGGKLQQVTSDESQELNNIWQIY
jgi:hypothetical protein